MARHPIQASADSVEGVPILVDVPGRGVVEFRFRTAIGINMLRTLQAIQSGGDDGMSKIRSVTLIADYLDRVATGPNADLWRELVNADTIGVQAIGEVFQAVREDAAGMDPTQPMSSPVGSSPTGQSSTGGASPEVLTPPPSPTTAS